MATHQDSTPFKSCSKCREVKPLADFYRHPSPAGRTPRCKACLSAETKVIRRKPIKVAYVDGGLGPSRFKCCTVCRTEKLPSEFRPARRPPSGLTPQCRGCLVAINRQWKIDHPDRIRADSASYRARNPDKIRASQAEQRRNNPEAYRLRNAEYRKANAVRWRANAARWAKEHPLEVWARLVNRRALKKASGRKITAAELRGVLTDSLGICSYCNGGGKLEVDHIEPLAKGGQHEPGNLTAACKTCNTRKNDFPLLLWLARIATDRARLARAA